jgi:hypothetical protein
MRKTLKGTNPGCQIPLSELFAREGARWKVPRGPVSNRHSRPSKGPARPSPRHAEVLPDCHSRAIVRVHCSGQLDNVPCLCQPCPVAEGSGVEEVFTNQRIASVQNRDRGLTLVRGGAQRGS